MIKVLIDDKEVDLGDAQMQVDYSIAKIGEIEKRSGARSTELNLPKTVNNRAIFENPDDVTSLSLKPYRRLKARLYVDGIDQKILFCTLESVNETYNVRLYGDNVSFFDLIKNEKLTDLDWSEYDYYHTYDEVANRRNQRGVVFPIIDNFKNPSVYCPDVLRAIDVRYLPPAVSVETIFEKVCSKYGYTLTNKVAERYEHPDRSLVIPFTGDKNYTRDNNGDRYNSIWYANTAVAKTPIIDRCELGYVSGGDPKYFDANVISGWNGYAVLNDELTLDYSVTITVDVTTDYAYIMQDLDITVINGNTLIHLFSVPYTQVPVGLNTYTFSGTTTAIPSSSFYDSNMFSITIYPSFDTINNLRTVSLVDCTFTITNVQITNPTEVNREPSTVISRQFTNVIKTIEGIKVSDVLKAYVQMFCGIIQADEIKKQVTIFNLLDITNNINNAIDWSDKLDMSEDAEKKFVFDYAQINTLDWDRDETLFVNQLGKIPLSSVTDAYGEILIDDRNLEEQQELVKLGFTCSETVTRLRGLKVCNIPIWDDVTLDYLGQAQKRLIFVRWRNMNEFPITANMIYGDGTNQQQESVNIPLTHFISNGEVYNLGFGDNLIEKWYGDFIQILDKTKIVNADLKLTASDINQLDFLKPVFIKYFNSWFYISGISEYTPGSNESTECELVKLF